VATLVDVLDVPRQAKRGFAVGALLAVVVFVTFVAVPGPRRSPVLYAALGFVLAVAVGLLVTAALVVVAAYRTAREL